ncbi:MAG: hypothetical protein JSU74_10635 [Candidatus Zixiibacteriota bacterium]|nr:MAG: hypothetical protein JSU74_10635 [candidate division Zixibacteria bacterium]
METAYRVCRCRRRWHGAIAATVLTALCIFTSVSGADAVRYGLCDVRAVYVFDDPRSIDWPAVYYLNDMFGCRVDLITTRERSRTETITRSLEDKELYLNTLHMSEADTAGAAELVAKLFSDRLPDLVIFADNGHDPRLESVKSAILDLSDPAARIFNILKIYRKFNAGQDVAGRQGSIVLNGRELLNRYRDRMALEIPSLLPWFNLKEYRTDRVIRYQPVKTNLPITAGENNLMAGISPFRLTEIIDSLFADGPMKQTFQKQAKKFITYFNASQISVGQRQVAFIIDGYRELMQLTRHKRSVEDIPEYQAYLHRLLHRAERAALGAVGINWDGKIILRDSPHGPRLKFLASVSADGPREVDINSFKFHPYWDTTVVELDSSSVTIAPHQSFTKEFFVEIDRAHLNGKTPDSLEFTVEVAYGQIPLVFTSKLPIWQAPDLNITFVPDFHFVKPFPDLEVDRVVSNLNLKAVIEKPYNYSGVVRLNLQTPRGLFAGAYRKDLQLEKGMLSETVRIPFTISNLFELGIQIQTVELLVDNKLVAADTSRIRIASCSVPDTVKVGFLPDSLGLLEDILRMTGATYRPLTDRSLVTADLDAYNVILIGSASYRNYPSLTLMKGRFEDYLRQGGSLVIFGQPEDWPGDVLPVSFVPTVEVVDQSEITNLISEARVLSRPYAISEKNLLSNFFKKQEVSPAVISPAEKVLITPQQASLLSVSRLGDGQIIFCGLPLLELITRLDIDAIHLFANILNY